MGAYKPAVIFKDDIYVMYYHAGGPTNNTCNLANCSEATGWNWTPARCEESEAGISSTEFIPRDGFFECNDRVMMAWKHLSCAIGGACTANHEWNVWRWPQSPGNYPAINNQECDLVNNPGANCPTTGVRSIATWNTPSSFPNTFLPLPGRPLTTKHTGAGGPTAIHAKGRYFMAYDASVMAPQVEGNANLDAHRIAWGHSANGTDWTFTGLILVDQWELQWSGGGVVADQLFLEYDPTEGKDFFYLLVHTLGWVPAGSGQHYLLRAEYTETAPFHGAWQLPQSLNADGTLGSWTNVPTNSRVDFFQGGNAPYKPYLTLTQTCSHFNAYASIAKVYASSTSSQYRYVTIVDAGSHSTSSCRETAGTTPEELAAAPQYPLHVFISDKLTKPPTQAPAKITQYQNRSHAKKVSDYGWQPNLVWLGPDPYYTKSYNPITLFLQTSTTYFGREHNISRVRLRLCGDIYGLCPP